MRLFLLLLVCAVTVQLATGQETCGLATKKKCFEISRESCVLMSNKNYEEEGNVFYSNCYWDSGCKLEGSICGYVKGGGVGDTCNPIIKTECHKIDEQSCDYVSNQNYYADGTHYYSNCYWTGSSCKMSSQICGHSSMLEVVGDTCNPIIKTECHKIDEQSCDYVSNQNYYADGTHYYSNCYWTGSSCKMSSQICGHSSVMVNNTKSF